MTAKSCARSEDVDGCSRSVSAAVAGYSEFTELARRVKDAGLMRRRYGYYWTKLIAVPVAFAASIVALHLDRRHLVADVHGGRASRSCSPRPRSSATTPRTGRSSARASGTTGRQPHPRRIRRHELRMVAAQAHPPPREPQQDRRRPRHRPAGRRLHAGAGRRGDRPPMLRWVIAHQGCLLLPDPAARGPLAARRRACTAVFVARAARPPARGDRVPRRAHHRLPRTRLPRALARQRARVPRDPARPVRLLHGDVVRPEPQGHAARAQRT